MRIWIIDHYAQPAKYKPLIRQTLFAKNLIRNGHYIRIFCASTVHNTKIDLINDSELYVEEIIDNISYTYIKACKYERNNIKRILNMYEFAMRLPKVCEVWAKKEGKPDCVLSCSMTLQACKAGIQIARKYHAKAIAQITDLWPESLVAYQKVSERNPFVLYFRKIEKWIYKNADRIIFSMEGAYDYIIEQGWDKEIPRSKVCYINNGIDFVQFMKNKEKYRIEDSDLYNKNIFKIVYVGSIRKVNNLSTILDAAKLIKEKNIKFLIWGGGDHLEELKKRVDRENICNVVFKGRVDKKFIPSITSCADVNLVHGMESPIFRFGVSANKIFDSLAAGKPILTTYHCKYNPALQCGASIEANNNTAEGIAEAVEKLYRMDEGERNKFSIYAYEGAKKYDFALLSERLINTIESLGE